MGAVGLTGNAIAPMGRSYKVRNPTCPALARSARAFIGARVDARKRAASPPRAGKARWCRAGVVS